MIRNKVYHVNYMYTYIRDFGTHSKKIRAWNMLKYKNTRQMDFCRWIKLRKMTIHSMDNQQMDIQSVY